MNRVLTLCLALCLSLGLRAAPVSAAEPVRIFAAASLRSALDDLAAHMGGITVSYAGSGTIARQVAQGAPADVVILASQAWMDWLVEEGHVPAGAVTPLLSNRLVLIGPGSSATLEAVTAEAILDRLAGGRLAIGQTTSVPAGIYGRQWLEAVGLWATLAPHLAPTDNVRAALALVERGEAPLGVVYASDAQAAADVRVVYDIPPDTHRPIVYPMAALSPRGESIATALQSAEALVVFRAHGLVPAGEVR